MSKPRGGNRPTRSIDMARKVLREYREVERRREEWAQERAVESLQRAHPDWKIDEKKER